MVANRKFSECGVMLVSAVAIYIFSYTPFILVRGFSDFLSLQGWMLQYWIHRHGSTANALTLINRLIGPFFFISKYNPLYRLASINLSGNYYLSLNEGVNPLIALLPFPVVYWQLRRCSVSHISSEKKMILVTSLLLLVQHVVTMDPFESWLFEPLLTLVIILTTSYLYRSLANPRIRLFALVYLAFTMSWTALMIGLSSRF